VVLYVCGEGTRPRSFAGLLGHPCGRAATALTDAGHAYETKVVRGYTSSPWTWPRRRRDRAEVKKLSGRTSVPILVLDDGEVVAGSRRIMRWAEDHGPPAVPRNRPTPRMG
jgi:glutathione S-transferase